MYQTSDQMIQFHMSALGAWQAATLRALDAVERLSELNVQAVRATLEEANDQAVTLLSVRDAQALGEVAASSLQPTTDKIVSYSKHLFDISRDAGTDIADMYSRQFVEIGEQFQQAVDSVAKSAPAGSESAATFVKSAVDAANTAFDQITKASKQVVDFAEANVAPAVKATPRVKKAA